jgi:thiamine kinase-like enzyme
VDLPALDDPTDLDPGLEALLDSLPCTARTPRTVGDLPGGLTNRNLKVTNPDGTCVVRIPGAGSDLLGIDRDTEHANSLAAAAAGVGPPVLHYRPGEGLVVGFLPGRTLTDADLHDPAVLRRIAAACRQLHAGPRFVNDFDMFEVQARYRRIVAEHGFRLPERYDEFAPLVARIREALGPRVTEPARSPSNTAPSGDSGDERQRGVGGTEPARPPSDTARSRDSGDERQRGVGATVPCNNDLLAANLLDDGERVRIIDYEYSGNNDPCFELGNIWSEAALPLPLLDELITAYFGRPRPAQVARARLFAVMSKYGWTLWASIQDGSSPMDFDFWSWGMEKYERAVREFDDPDLDRLLTAAQQPD